MKTEMDAMNMDERRRTAWLRANRATLILVGLCWSGMIAWELIRHRTPAFLIAMLPAFAAARFGFYLFYTRAR